MEGPRLKIIQESSLEATPRDIKLDDVRAALEQVPGVREVHDLHVWCLTSGFYALSAHATVQDLSEGKRILEKTRRILNDKFHIGHMTLQLEENASQIERVPGS